MNSIASFLPNLPTRPLAASQGTRGDSESLTDGNSKGDGFDAVLSGLSTNSSSEETPTSPTAPVRSSIPGAGSGRTEEALVPTSRTPSAGGSLVLSRLAARGGPLATGSLTTNALAAASRATGSLAAGSIPTIAGAKASAAQIGQANNSSSAAPAGAPANVATTGASDTPGSKDLIATTSLVAAGTSASAKPVTVTADGDNVGSGAAAAKADASSGTRNASANANAAISSAATVIAATLQGVLPAAQSIETRPSKTSRTDSSGRPTSTATSKSSDKKSSETAAPTVGIIDPTVQAAMAATVPAISTSQDLPAKPDGTQSQSPAAALQIDVRAQDAADGNAAVGAGQNDAGTISPDSFAGSVEMTVTTVSSATHFAPVARLSPVQQIADAVIGAVPDLSQGLAGSAASGPTDAAEPEGSASVAVFSDPAASADSGPVKTLNLELEPASLGTVTITLSLSAGGLDVRLAASQSSTMNLINKDKDSLSDQLRQSGYSLAGVAVTLSGQDGSGVANNGSATQDPSGQAASQGGGQAMSHGGSSNGNGTSQNNSGRAAPAQAPLGVAPNSEMAIAPRRVAGGDLYL